MRRAFTRADYEAMPDEWRGELIAGELVMASAPVPYHGYLQMELVRRLDDHLGPDQRWRVLCAPTDVLVDDTNVYQPDLLVLPEDSPKPHLEWEIPLPIWVAEILSPGTARYDREEKLPRLGEAGAREGWLIAPHARQVEVFDLVRSAQHTYGPGDDAVSLVLPGFRVAVSDFLLGGMRGVGEGRR